MYCGNLRVGGSRVRFPVLKISLGNTEAFELLGRMEFCVVGVLVFSRCVVLFDG